MVAAPRLHAYGDVLSLNAPIEERLNRVLDFKPGQGISVWVVCAGLI